MKYPFDKFPETALDFPIAFCETLQIIKTASGGVL